jgi:hypothetical protein
MSMNSSNMEYGRIEMNNILNRSLSYIVIFPNSDWRNKHYVATYHTRIYWWRKFTVDTAAADRAHPTEDTDMAKRLNS